MESVLVFLWLLVALGFLISLLVSSYFVYVRGAKPFDVFAKLVLALIVYGFCTFGTGFLAGLTVYIGAHTNPVGQALGTRECIIGAGLLALYAAIGWLMCSFIVGHMIWPVSHGISASKEETVL